MEMLIQKSKKIIKTEKIIGITDQSTQHRLACKIFGLRNIYLAVYWWGIYKYTYLQNTDKIIFAVNFSTRFCI